MITDEDDRNEGKKERTRKIRGVCVCVCACKKDRSSSCPALVEVD